jgi:hypothetical protein
LVIAETVEIIAVHKAKADILAFTGAFSLFFLNYPHPIATIFLSILRPDATEENDTFVILFDPSTEIFLGHFIDPSCGQLNGLAKGVLGHF